MTLQRSRYHGRYSHESELYAAATFIAVHARSSRKSHLRNPSVLVPLPLRGDTSQTEDLIHGRRVCMNPYPEEEDIALTGRRLAARSSG